MARLRANAVLSGRSPRLDTVAHGWRWRVISPTCDAYPLPTQYVPVSSDSFRNIGGNRAIASNVRRLSNHDHDQ